PGRGQSLEKPPRLSHGVHRSLDDGNGHAAGAHGILQRLGDLLKRRRTRGALRVLRFQKLDVVEHLICLLIRHRLQFAPDAFRQDFVHGVPPPSSSVTRSTTGLPRNRLRPFRTRAMICIVASGVSECTAGSFMSDTMTYTKP